MSRPITKRTWHSLRHFVLAAGVAWFVVADADVNAQSSSITFDLSGNFLARASGNLAAPQILSQPQQQLVEPGDTTSFSVALADTQGVTYQWRFNGNPIGGATSSSLVLTNVSAASAGLYSVIVTNGAGSVTSADAALLIDSDADGLADSWEIANFGNLNQTASGDFDADGVSNLDEYRDGTDPKSNTSFKTRLTLITDGGGTVVVSPLKSSYNIGEVVTLTAVPAAPNTFLGWTGDLTGTTNPATVTMSAQRTVTAHFLAPPLPTGAISWWKAEGNAQDFMGVNHGALINGTTFVAGKVGQAFSFNGTNQSVDIPDSPSLRPRSLTLEAWVKLISNASGARYIMAKPLGNGTADSFELWYSNGFLSARLANVNGSAPTISTDTLVGGLNTWHHVAYTFDDTTKIQSLYFDGAFIKSSNAGQSISYDSGPVLLGRDSDNGAATSFLSGLIDEATIYNRALTATEISSIYMADLSGKLLPQLYFTSPLQLPDGVLSTAYSYQLTALGAAPLSYAVPAENLPPGLAISSSGLITGTPTSAGSYSFPVRVTDTNGQSTEQIVGLQIVAAAVPSPGLVSWWRAEGNAQDAIASNHGSLVNGATFAAGEVGQGFSLNGTNQSVDVPDAASLRPVSLTAEAWVMLNSTTGDRFIVAKPLGSATLDSYALWVSNGVLTGAMASASGFGPTVTSAFVPAAGTWHHVAYTFDDPTRRQTLYLDGTAVASSLTNRSISYDSSPFLLGRDIQNASAYGFFAGGIDEAAIYNRALTSTEIAGVYATGVAGKTTAGPFFNIAGSLPDGYVNQAYTQTITTSRGTAPVTFSLVSGALPTGLTLTSGGTLTGTPTAGGTFTFTVRATDAATLFAEQQFTVSIHQPVTVPGLVSWWRGENNAQDSIASNHGTVEGATTFPSAKVGHGFSFDGSTASVLIPTINLGSTFAIEMWVLPTRAGGFEHLVSNDYHSSANFGALYFRNDHFEYWQGSTTRVSTTAGGVPLGVWSHVVLTYDGTVDRIYINGQLAGTSAAHAQSFNTQVRFGWCIVSSDVRFLGGLDEVSFYNRALDATDAAALYAAGSAGKTTGLFINAASGLPDAVQNQPYSQTLTALGGAAPMTYSINNGALPAGITLSAAGVLSGTPTATGTFTFGVHVVDANQAAADQIFTLRVYPRVGPPAGIISWWRGEGNANDSIGSNNGTLLNGATFGAGKVGQAFALDGNNDYVSMPDSASLRPSSLTVEAWVNFTTYSGFGLPHIFSKTFGTGNADSLSVYVSSNSALTGGIEDSAGGSAYISVPFTPDVGRWYHIAFTFDNSTKEQRLYLDGVTVAGGTSNRTIAYDTNPFVLGTDIDSGSVGVNNSINARIDEAALYNRALAANEIAALYNAGPVGKSAVGPYFNIPAKLPDATVNVAYSQTLTTLRGSGAVTCTLVAGALPGGLVMNAGGAITGTPATSGDYSFVVRATDAASQFIEQPFTLHVGTRSRISTGAISWWRGEGDATDAIGTNPGTLVGGTTFAAGKSGQAFALNGTDALVSVPDASSLRPTSLTLEAWALFTSTPSTSQNIVCKSIGTSGFDSYAIWYGQGGFKGAVADSAGFGTILNYAFTPSLGQWYHVAYTFDGNTRQQALYVNDALVAIGIGNKSPGYNTQPFFIGGDIASSGTGFGSFFPGLIDEPAIYNRVLSGTEINAIYKADSAGKRTFFPYETWKLTNLGDPDASASADPDHDGLSNLFEYAFNSDPTNPASSNRPAVSIDSTNISLTYTKVLAATDLTYSVEQSTDLSAWQTVTPTNQILSDNGIVQVIKAQVPRSNAGSGGRLFLRLRVTVAN